MNASVIFHLEKWPCVTNLTFFTKMWLYSPCTQKCQIKYLAQLYLQLIGGKRVLWNSLKFTSTSKHLQKSSYFHWKYYYPNVVLPHVVYCPLPKISCTSYMVYIFNMSAKSFGFCLDLCRITWDSTRWKGILFSGPSYR